MKPLVSGTTFVFAAVIMAVGCGFAFHGLGNFSAWLSFAVGLAAAVAAWMQSKDSETKPPGAWDWIVFAMFGLASLRAFLWLVYQHDDEIAILSPNNLGDMSLHLDFIRYLASGVPFWPESPILTGAPLTYPLGADLFNSLLEIGGVDTLRGLVWAALFGAFLTGLALWKWGGPFTIAAFLFNGGLAGFAVLKTGLFEDFQAELMWKNFFLSMFVTQRGLLFAIPAGLLLLKTWRDEYFREEKRSVPFWLQLVLYGGMPLFSMHTFIFLSAVLAVIFLCRAPSRKPLLFLGGSAFVPATLAVLLITGFFYSSGGMHLAWKPDFGQPWWGLMQHWMFNGKDWGTFLRDFGIVIPFGVITGILVARDKNIEARCFAGTAIGMFVLCCFVAFSRWEWDNMKLMMWSWLVLAPYLWSHVLRPLPLPARVALCVLLFFPGAASLVGGLDGRHGYMLAHRSEVDAWRSAVADIPATDRFACMPDYNHPLILLGRKVACGYDGHLWSHGLNYQDKMALLKDSLSGVTPWSESAPKLNVQWAAIRQTDQPPAVPQGLGTLIDLRPLLKPGPASQLPPPTPQRSVDLSW